METNLVASMFHTHLPFSHKTNMNYIQRVSSYRAVSTLQPDYKQQSVMLYMEIIIILSEIHKNYYRKVG